MAFVDLGRNVLVLKALLAGPPAVGKTRRLAQLASVGRHQSFGSTPTGPQRMASLPLDSISEGRPVELEVYEWHGPERADVRAKGLFVGLDGLIYIADAREDRRVDTIRQLEFLVETVGKSKMRRMPALLILGRKDEGLLALSSLEGKLTGVQWSHRFDEPMELEAPFIDAVRVYGEVMLSRML